MQASNRQDNFEIELSADEMDEGWHFCHEFDGLLVGPGMGELASCRCFHATHKVYKDPAARGDDPTDGIIFELPQ